jgi:hypothetical protein
VQTIELLARVITHIADQELEDANALLPELLAHPMWKIEIHNLWKLSLAAYKNKKGWLEAVLDDTETGHIHAAVQWLIRCAYYSLYEPLEYMLDLLTGVDSDDDFTSPLKQYYFDETDIHADSFTYVEYLSSLTSLRHKLREYRPQHTLKLSDFNDFIAQHRQLGIVLQQKQ